MLKNNISFFLLLKVFKMEEIKKMSKDFNDEIGSGGFSNVYKVYEKILYTCILYYHINKYFKNHYNKHNIYHKSQTIKYLK